MTTKDESFMYSGLTSASTRARQAQKAKEQTDKDVDRHHVLPAATLINQLIEKEKQNVLDLKSLITNGFSPEDDIKAELLARQLTYKFIVGFQTQVNNLLREPRPKKESDNG